MIRTATLSQTGFNKLDALIKTANRKAKRLGLAPLTLSAGHYYQVTDVDHRLGMKVTRNVCDVTVKGFLPRLQGDWTLEAVARQEQSTGVSVWTYCAADVNTDDLPPNTVCDHCNKRRTRNRIFYVRNTNTNKLFRLGSTCVEDFLGDTDPDTILWSIESADLLNNMERLDDGELSESDRRYFNQLPTPLKVLELAYYLSRHDGYITAKDAEYSGSVSTAYKVRETLEGYGKGIPIGGEEEDWDHAYYKAVDTLEWLRSQRPEKDGTTYMTNLLAVAQADVVAPAHIGILASAVVAYRRYLEQERKKALPTNNEYVGTIGKREAFEITLEALRFHEGAYGTTRIHTFRTTGGESLVWFCSGSGPDLEIGDTATIKGTIKKHSEFRGVKQTTINRVKVVG